MGLVSAGTPVTSVRQWVWGLSPNAAGSGWNYIAALYNYPTSSPVEWVVVKNLTTAPTVQYTTTTTKRYPNSLYNPSSSRGQIRAPNGRIYWPLFSNGFVVYDPTTEQVSELAPFVETPAINPNQSTIPYATCFDHAGTLYFATQESSNRPACVVSIDTTTNAITVRGYVGSGGTAGTTYGYYVVADTATAQKYAYVAYGQSPWQLWALNLTTGAASKLAEVTAAGFISFQEIVGQGYVATVQTSTGVGGVTTKYWCLDGALYPYTTGQVPPGGLARNVSPASNPLVTPPDLDTAAGYTVGWRPYGNNGAYTYANFTPHYTAPVRIESLVSAGSGILGNAEQYNGFFQSVDTEDFNWFGPSSGLVSGGPRINVDGTVYFAGYPNGALYRYNPNAAWVNNNTNPVLLGAYGTNGTLAGMKYADCIGWSPAQEKLFCAGSRERNGIGLGIGSYDVKAATFAGTFALTGMTTVVPSGDGGLVVDDAADRVVVSAVSLGTEDGSLYCFNRKLTSVVKRFPLSGVSNLGPIFPTGRPGVVMGVVQRAGKVVVYQYNHVTAEMVAYTTLGITGAVGAATVRKDGSVWVVVGNSLVRIDQSGAASTIMDLSSASPVGLSAFTGDNNGLYVSGSASGAQLWYTPIANPQIITPAPPAPVGGATSRLYGNLLKQRRY